MCRSLVGRVVRCRGLSYHSPALVSTISSTLDTYLLTIALTAFELVKVPPFSRKNGRITERVN